jgi:tetratricopeptide (TPR) repeat protein
MIRAVEARTMETGVAPFKAPASVSHTEFASVERERRATEQKAEAVRQATVKRDMEQGYVLTAYFYGALATFEKEPQSFKETIGEIVYGMDVPSELSHAKHIEFSQQNEGDVVHHGTRQLHGLDLAEMKLLQGDVNAASTLAHQELDRHTGDTARADFLLARCAVMQRNVEEARHYFEETIRLGKDPRLLSWSHIYLGRMDDLEHSRDEALAQYQQALVTRDGQLDTKQAAESGLKQPYGPPPGARQQEEDDSGDDSQPAKDTAPQGPAAQTPATQPPAPPAATPPQR